MAPEGALLTPRSAAGTLGAPWLPFPLMTDLAHASTEYAARLSIDVVDAGGVAGRMAEDVLAGLTAAPKQLPPKYFYDDAGSRLFEQITRLPEYYPSRAERELLEETADELMAELRPAEIVELGAGSSAKTRRLLSAPTAPEHLRRFVPLDVSREIVESSALGLLADFPYLSVHGVIGDFERHLHHVPQAIGTRLVLFLGGTIGNLHPPERTAFLASVRGLLGPGDRVLIGLDLVKDVATMEAAYNDSAGVTAEFNRNMLRFINRELGANFEPEAFAHRAFFNAEHSRIEMHLAPSVPQEVSAPDISLSVTISPSETIWTESSYKFTPESVAGMLADAGLRLERCYANDRPDRRFALALAAPA